MVAFAKTFNSLASFRALVVGDLMVDAHIFGEARRISPEAPVPVIHVRSQESRPGGAGNVVLNLVSMGAQVTVLGRVGDDSPGKQLCRQFFEEGVGTEGVYTESGYSTPIKNRVIAHSQHVLRIDYETTEALSPELEAKIIEVLPTILEGVNIVAVSDYGKGFLTDKLLEAILRESAKKNIPTVVDPKGIEFHKYRGVTWLKPNLSEAYAAAKLPTKAPLEDVAKELYEQTKAEWLMITRSEAGISLFHKGAERQDFPVAVKELKDVTGAGDTVLAMLTVAIANKLTPAEGAYFCNIAAGIAIERIGCARVSLKELAQRLLEQNVAHKIYEHEEQIDNLEDLLKHGGYQLLKVPSSSGLTSAVFREIRRMRSEDPLPLLVHVQDPKHDDEMVNILADLHEVDFVISKPSGLERLMKRTPPVRTLELS